MLSVFLYSCKKDENIQTKQQYSKELIVVDSVNKNAVKLKISSDDKLYLDEWSENDFMLIANNKGIEEYESQKPIIENNEICQESNFNHFDSSKTLLIEILSNDFKFPTSKYVLKKIKSKAFLKCDFNLLPYHHDIWQHRNALAVKIRNESGALLCLNNAWVRVYDNGNYLDVEPYQQFEIKNKYDMVWSIRPSNTLGWIVVRVTYNNSNKGEVSCLFTIE